VLQAIALQQLVEQRCPVILQRAGHTKEHDRDPHVGEKQDDEQESVVPAHGVTPWKRHHQREHPKQQQDEPGEAQAAPIRTQQLRVAHEVVPRPNEVKGRDVPHHHNQHPKRAHQRNRTHYCVLGVSEKQEMGVGC